MNSQTPSDMALKRCDEQITWYQDSSKWMRLFHYGGQCAVIVLTASVPLLALLAEQTVIKESSSCIAAAVRSNLLQAGLAGLAAVILSLGNLFQWQKKWLSRAYTRELLKSERIKFVTRAGEAYASAKNDEEAGRIFVARIEDLAEIELKEWKSLQAAGDRQ
jgi:hypothetical protein